jgi:hypothetical protein
MEERVPHEEELLSVKDLQKICKIGRSSAYNLANELNPIRIHGVLRVRRSVLDQYLRDHACAAENRW